MTALKRLLTFAVLLAGMSCGRNTVPPTRASPSPSGNVSDDASLFRRVTETDPFAGYTVFLNADEFTDGRLNGSEAHRPIVRVSLNATAFGALQNGRLPPGGGFPAGSVVFKEVRSRADAPTTRYAVMYKDAGSAFAGNGWVWAEFRPDGSVQYSVSNRGTACTGCHLREQGAQNDLVRTFERQR
jgi:hypothetical protein